MSTKGKSVMLGTRQLTRYETGPHAGAYRLLTDRPGRGACYAETVTPDQAADLLRGHGYEIDTLGGPKTTPETF